MGKTNSNNSTVKTVNDLKDLPDVGEKKVDKPNAAKAVAKKPNKPAPKQEEAKPEGKKIEVANEDKAPEILKKSGDVAAVEVPKVQVNLDAKELGNTVAEALKPCLDAIPERTANAVTDALSEQLNDISEKLDGVANNAPIHITKEVKVQEDTWGITTKKLPYLFGGGLIGGAIATAVILLGGDN